jgi:TonB family protein
MDKRMFEDLVVSAPVEAVRRHAAPLPVSVALHAAALAAALIVPVMRSADLPAPQFGPPVWIPLPMTPPPPPRPVDIRVRVPAARPARTARVVDEIPAAVPPGPSVPTTEPDALPVDEGPAPCLFGCAAAAAPNGSGDGVPAGPDGSGEGAGGGAPIRPGGKIQPPVRTVYVEPVYSELARRAGVSGMVILECTIDPTGHVTDARILSGHPLLNDSALTAVRQWRYTPTRLNGVTVPVLMTVTVRFIRR